MKRQFTLMILLMLVCVLLAALPVAADGTTNGNVPTVEITPEDNGSDIPVAPTPSALTPQLIVSSYSFGGDSVAAGHSFTLSFTLKNTSKSLNIRNIVVKVDGGESFALNKQSNTIYIEKISPGGTSGQSVSLISASTLADGSYPVTISASYEYYDSDAKMSGSSEAALTIPVAQDMRVQIKRVAPNTPEIYAFDTFNIAYSFINTSFTQLLNTQVEIKDKDSGETLASAFIGTVEPSSEASGSSNLQLSFEEIGTKNLEFLISYEDNRLNVKTVSQDLTVEVLEYVEPDWEVEGMVEEEAESSSSLPLIVLILVALTGVIIVTAILVHRRRAKKLELELLEDEDEDEDL